MWSGPLENQAGLDGILLVTVYSPSTGVGLAGLPNTETYFEVEEAPGAAAGSVGPGFEPLPKLILTTGSPNEPVQKQLPKVIVAVCPEILSGAQLAVL